MGLNRFLFSTENFRIIMFTIIPANHYIIECDQHSSDSQKFLVIQLCTSKHHTSSCSFLLTLPTLPHVFTASLLYWTEIVSWNTSTNVFILPTTDLNIWNQSKVNVFAKHFCYNILYATCHFYHPKKNLPFSFNKSTFLWLHTFIATQTLYLTIWPLFFQIFFPNTLQTSINHIKTDKI